MKDFFDWFEDLKTFVMENNYHCYNVEGPPNNNCSGRALAIGDPECVYCWIQHDVLDMFALESSQISLEEYLDDKIRILTDRYLLSSTVVKALTFRNWKFLYEENINPIMRDSNET